MLLLQLATLAFGTTAAVSYPITTDTQPALPSAIVVSFEMVDDRIYFPAEVAGHRGHVFLDTGASTTVLNPLHLKATPTGLDTVSTPASTPPSMTMFMTDLPVRIGTTEIRIHPGFNPLTVAFGSPDWFSGVEMHTKRTNLGILGVPFMRRFETIIDYRQHRLIFIPLDHAGRRLVALPGYTPVQTLPMWVGNPNEGNWYVKAQLGSTTDSVMLDTGGRNNEVNADGVAALGSHLTPAGTNPRGNFPLFKLDQLTFAGRLVKNVTFSRTESASFVLGNPFLSQQGVIGFNFRAGQFTVYR